MSKGEQGEIFVVSAPSGAGKTTLCREVCQGVEGLIYAISHTTRPPRAGEVEGGDYYFVRDDAFQTMINRGEFLEWAWIYGYRYGTSKRSLQDRLEDGMDVIMDVDIQGAYQLRNLDMTAHYIFVLPPTWEALRERLSARETESPQEIERRLLWAKKEVKSWTDYDYIILNEDLETAKCDLKSLIRAQRCRADRRRDWVEELISHWTFAEE